MTQTPSSRFAVALGVAVAGGAACEPPDAAPHGSRADAAESARAEEVRQRAPLGRTYALASAPGFGPYVKGGRGSAVRERIEFLAETLTFADTSADSGTVTRAQVERLTESVGGRVRSERIDTTVRIDSFRRAGDSVVFITPGPRLTFLHTFRMRAGGDTLETTAARCLPTPCVGTAALQVWLYGRVGPPWWGRYVDSAGVRRVTLRPGAPKVREVVIRPGGVALGGPSYAMGTWAAADAAPGVSRAVRWWSSDTSIVRVVPTSDTTAMICPEPRKGDATIVATSVADPRVRYTGRVTVFQAYPGWRHGGVDSVGPPGPCRRP